MGVVEPLHISILGGSRVGKTSLLQSFITNKPVTGPFESTLLDYHAHLVADKKKNKITLEILDTSGQEQNTNTRRLALEGSEVFVVCFAIDDRNSFNFVSRVLVPEINTEVGEGRVPIILVGTKAEIRKAGLTYKSVLSTVASGGEPALLSSDDGEKLGEQIGAVAYLECSSQTGDGIKEIFEQSIHTILNRRVVKVNKNSFFNSLRKTRVKFESIHYHLPVQYGPSGDATTVTEQVDYATEGEEQVEELPVAPKKSQPQMVPLEPEKTSPKPALKRGNSLSRVFKRMSGNNAAKESTTESQSPTLIIPTLPQAPAADSKSSLLSPISPNITESNRFQRRRSSSMSDTEKVLRKKSNEDPAPIVPPTRVRRPIPPAPNARMHTAISLQNIYSSTSLFPVQKSPVSSTLESSSSHSASSPTSEEPSETSFKGGVVRILSSIDLNKYVAEQKEGDLINASPTESPSGSTIDLPKQLRPRPKIAPKPVMKPLPTIVIDAPSENIFRRRSSSNPSIPLQR